MSVKPVLPEIQESELLDYTDYPKVRDHFKSRVLDAVTSAPATSNARFTLRLADLRYDGKQHYSLKDQKKAILEGKSVSDRLSGKYELVDNETGNVVSTTNRKSLMNVPYLTNRGTYIRQGTEYTMSKQFRLVPGVYTRVTDDGNVEAQFNAKPRTGPSFRMYMEPSSGFFYMRFKGRKVPLYSVMRAMGHTDEALTKAWGADLVRKNKSLERSPYAVNFLKQFLPEEGPREEIIKELQKDAASAWDVVSTWKEAGQKDTMPVPENFDVVEELGDGYKIHAGGNDWEPGYSSICVMNKPDFKGIQTRMWFTVKLPKGIKDNSDQSSADSDKLHDHGLAAIKTMVRLSNELKRTDSNPEGQNGFYLWSEVFNHKDMKPYIEKMGLDKTTWNSHTPAAYDLDKIASGVNYSEELRDNLVSEFGRTELSPRTTRRTLGKEYSNVTPDAMLTASRKILGVHRQTEDTDSRDSLAYQDIHDISDFLPEKIQNDQGGVLRQLLWKITNKNGDTSKIPPSILDKHVSHLFNQSGMSQAIEEINPSDMYDQNQRVQRLGEGAMSSVDIAPKESRNVQPSYLNYVDPVVAPESLRIGLDMRLARNVRKGPDNELYTKFIDAKTGKQRWVGVRAATESVIAFPEAMNTKDAFVPAMDKSKGMSYVKREDVDFVIPSGDDMFSDTANLVPLKSGVKGMRLLMGNKFGRQALPLVNREAPLVQTMDADGKSMEDRMGRFMGAAHASKEGMVKAVYKDHILMANTDGTEEKVELYENHPFARKSVAGSSLIYVKKEDGSIWKGRIEDYVHGPSDRTLSYDPLEKTSAWKLITGFVEIPLENKKLLRVTTRSGRQVVLTEDHSLVSLDEYGDLVPILPGECGIGTKLPVASIPVGTSEGLVYDQGVLDGLYLAEGHVPPSQPNLVIIACDPADRKEQLMQLFSGMGHSPFINGGTVCFTDKEAADRLRNRFGHLSHNKKIPTDVLLATAN